MSLRKLLLPTMIAAALAVPAAAAQDTQGHKPQDADARKADAKADSARKDAQAPAAPKKDPKAEEKARKAAKAAEQPDEPEEDDR